MEHVQSFAYVFVRTCCSIKKHLLNPVQSNLLGDTDFGVYLLVPRSTVVMSVVVAQPATVILYNYIYIYIKIKKMHI